VPRLSLSPFSPPPPPPPSFAVRSGCGGAGPVSRLPRCTCCCCCGPAGWRTAHHAARAQLQELRRQSHETQAELRRNISSAGRMHGRAGLSRAAIRSPAPLSCLPSDSVILWAGLGLGLAAVCDQTADRRYRPTASNAIGTAAALSPQINSECFLPAVQGMPGVINSAPACSWMCARARSSSGVLCVFRVRVAAAYKNPHARKAFF
jgi:hypothetical protein